MSPHFSTRRRAAPRRRTFQPTDPCVSPSSCDCRHLLRSGRPPDQTAPLITRNGKRFILNTSLAQCSPTKPNISKRTPAIISQWGYSIDDRAVIFSASGGGTGGRTCQVLPRSYRLQTRPCAFADRPAPMQPQSSASPPGGFFRPARARWRAFWLTKLSYVIAGLESLSVHLRGKVAPITTQSVAPIGD